MPPASLQGKKAYYARVRRSNYVASLRLEGFQVTQADATRKLPTRESVLRACLRKLI
ncbi:YhfG family protein [Pseudomonas sp.]|uniref:YhfG family protein n=1 Tax=Pseudomonas sp. TaxID=306 RepID=UPI003A97CF89